MPLMGNKTNVIFFLILHGNLYLFLFLKKIHKKVSVLQILLPCAFKQVPVINMFLW